jgi:hypothetical protein
MSLFKVRIKNCVSVRQCLISVQKLIMLIPWFILLKETFITIHAIKQFTNITLYFQF